MNIRLCLLPALYLLSAGPLFAQVEQVWLSYRGHDPSKLCVNWTTKEPGDSLVRFGLTKDYGHEVRRDGNATLHHVEIPVAERDAVYHYSVVTGRQSSPDATFKTWPSDELRVAVVANWHARPDLSAILKDKVHLLLTAGDNIPSLWQKCGAGEKECITPYAELIGAYPELFRSTPFMPVLGNHDREIRPRGQRPPPEPVYDVDATAFRRCFELPDDEWKWHFDVPGFAVRFIALDLNHIQDRGTTWQTCHDYGVDSQQFRWYQQLMADRPAGFVITLYNERNASMRGQEQGAWRELFGRGTACITGFGHFAERAEVDGQLYFNTSLQGRGAKYPDPASKKVVSEDNYLLLTFNGNAMTAELKNLSGQVLDRVEVQQ